VRIRSTAAFAIAAASCALAGCGGRSGSAEAPAVGSDFAKRAVSVCNEALRSKQAWKPFPVSSVDPGAPTRSALPEVARWLKQEVAPTFDAWLSGLRDLGQPRRGRQAWSRTIAAVARIGDLNGRQIAAAQSGDVKAFAAATAGLHDTQRQLERATTAAGVPTCADVHKG
jgi:hypothetical protein